MGLPIEAHEEALRLVAAEASSLMASCEAAAVTVVHDDEPVLVVGTCPLGRQLEDVQWAAGHGPGIDAIRQLQVFNVACLVSTSSWPEFTEVALSWGVRSSLAVPVTARGRALGALNLYSLVPDAFTGNERIGLQYATAAAQVLAGVDWIGGVDLRSPPVRTGPGGSGRDGARS